MLIERRLIGSADGLRVTNPHGPHHGHVDAVAGGADSSPWDAMSSEERHALLGDERKSEERLASPPETG